MIAPKRKTAKSFIIRYYHADPSIGHINGRSALMIVQEELEKAITDEERAACLEIIEMLNNPHNIKRSGFVRIK